MKISDNGSHYDDVDVVVNDNSSSSILLDGHQEDNGPKAWKDMLRELYDALYSRQKVYLTVAEPEENIREIVVHPHFLAHFPDTFYLFAVKSDGSLVNIPLKHVLEIECLNEPFRDPLYYENKIRYGEGWIPSGNDYEVKLRFGATCKWAMNLLLCGEQKIEFDGNNILISFSTDDLECVSRLAQFLSSRVHVEKPSLLCSLLEASRLNTAMVYNGAAMRRSNWTSGKD